MIVSAPLRRMTYLASMVLCVWSGASHADWTEARCDFYPKGEDKASAVTACTFSQRQGAVSITIKDGDRHDLTPDGDTPGNYTDQAGQQVYRQSGLGDQGLIFRFPEESIYVYWSTAGLPGDSDDDNPTAPFSTADYDATTLLPCRSVDADSFASCPAGILRMENNQASIAVKGLDGDIFTINFLGEVINASNRTVDATLDGDTWRVTINDAELYLVPQAAISGG